MSESKQDGFKTLGWILNKSESGLFLAVAGEKQQTEIREVYQAGRVGIYDYRQHPERYAFQRLNEWFDSLPTVRTFLIFNFQFAVQSPEDLKRLNFSRDMLAGLGKNLIFFTTGYGDEQLSREIGRASCRERV